MTFQWSDINFHVLSMYVSKFQKHRKIHAFLTSQTKSLWQIFEEKRKIRTKINHPNRIRIFKNAQKQSQRFSNPIHTKRSDVMYTLAHRHSFHAERISGMLAFWLFVYKWEEEKRANRKQVIPLKRVRKRFICHIVPLWFLASITNCSSTVTRAFKQLSIF